MQEEKIVASPFKTTLEYERLPEGERKERRILATTLWDGLAESQRVI
jgi:hypothetical protein